MVEDAIFAALAPLVTSREVRWAIYPGTDGVIIADLRQALRDTVWTERFAALQAGDTQMADLGETFDGSVYMEIGGNRAPAPVDPIRKSLDGRAIFANMVSRFDGAPPSVNAQLPDRRASNTDLGEVFDGSKIDMGPLSALDELRQHQQWVCWALVTAPARRSRPSRRPVRTRGGLDRTPSLRIGEPMSRPRLWPSAASSPAWASS